MNKQTDEAFIGDMIALIGQELPTLRDRFAIAALPIVSNAIIESIKAGSTIVPSDDATARIAYGMADAMMKAREVK